MMKRPEFLETKRTPRYSLRKLNVGVASVLLGVTIFGINFTDHSVKAATIENVEYSNSSVNSNSQQTSAVVLRTTGQTNTQEATSTTEKVQQNSTSNDATEKVKQSSAKNGAGNDVTEKVKQSSASNDATANNSTEAATTSQSAPKTQGSADTDIKSSTAKSAAKLAFMNLMAVPGTGTNTGNGRNTASTAGQNGNNTQPAKENQGLANKTNLTSSDNYSSNIYKGTDGKYYKIVTINGQDYVYRAADIQANGTAFGQSATTADDTKNNINISKKDLGNGKTRWTVVFFPHKGLQNVGSDISGLISAKFGIALTSDYQIVGNVDMEVITDPKKSFGYYTFEKDSTSATEDTLQNPLAEVDFSFNPKTNVDKNTGLINSETMPAYNNKYLQGPYYFTTATDVGAENLWQTYFFNHRNEVYYNNAYDGKTPYLGGDHDFHLNNFEIKNKTGVDGAKQGDKIIYDTLGYRLNSKNTNPNGVFSSNDFNQAMEFKSQGTYNNEQFSSYVISFTTQHTDSHEVRLATPTDSKKQQFSGIAANIYSFQNMSLFKAHYKMYSSLYGEQRALNAKGDPVEAKDIIPNWDDAKAANKAIDDALVNKKGEINSATNIDQATKDNLIKDATAAADAAKNAIVQATTADAIKKAQDDGVSNINNVKVPTSLEAAKTAANNAIDTALTTQTNAINHASNLSDQEKQDLVKQATEAANTAKATIAKATTNDGASQAGKAGVAEIEKAVPTSLEAAKTAANNAIDTALTTQTNA
ncbi:LEA family epithelial adhesin, partial [Limosilactobacillus galli]|uniref:LEA family epithelial adhesin n=1 Tax=Limosilactobacillus galli TaxID=2991834 RepID=UPI0024BAF720